ncbi:MAG: type II secretion system F family protein [Nitrospirota bacterium]
MSPLAIIVGGTFLVVGLVSLVLLSLVTSRKGVVLERLDDLRKGNSREAEGLDISRREEPAWQKAALAISSAVPLSEKNKYRYRINLAHAGFRKSSALEVFIGIKLLLSFGFGAVSFIYLLAAGREFRIALAMGIISFIIGLLLPNLWLNGKVKKRKTEIFHTLPDVLDLLTVCVEAGLGLDAAIIKISEEKEFTKQHLAKEFRIVSQEIRAGKPRVEALKDLGERTGVDDIKALVALLVQTEKLGASLSRSLRVHSDSLRTKRRQIAEEAAAKTSVKLIFPLAFFIFPALLVVLLGPAVISIFSTVLAQGK